MQRDDADSQPEKPYGPCTLCEEPALSEKLVGLYPICKWHYCVWANDGRFAGDYELNKTLTPAWLTEQRKAVAA